MYLQVEDSLDPLVQLQHIMAQLAPEAWALHPADAVFFGDGA